MDARGGNPDARGPVGCDMPCGSRVALALALAGGGGGEGRGAGREPRAPDGRELREPGGGRARRHRAGEGALGARGPRVPGRRLRGDRAGRRISSIDRRGPARPRSRDRAAAGAGGPPARRALAHPRRAAPGARVFLEPGHGRGQLARRAFLPRDAFGRAAGVRAGRPPLSRLESRRLRLGTHGGHARGSAVAAAATPMRAESA